MVSLHGEYTRRRSNAFGWVERGGRDAARPSRDISPPSLLYRERQILDCVAPTTTAPPTGAHSRICSAPPRPTYVGEARIEILGMRDVDSLCGTISIRVNVLAAIELCELYFTEHFSARTKVASCAQPAEHLISFVAGLAVNSSIEQHPQSI